MRMHSKRLSDWVGVTVYILYDWLNGTLGLDLPKKLWHVALPLI